MGIESDEGPIVDSGEADLRERPDAAGEGDDGITVQRNERVSGVAESGYDRDVDVLVRVVAVRSGKDTDRPPALGLRTATDRFHRAAAAATDHRVTVVGEFATDRLRSIRLFVGNRSAADNAHSHTRETGPKYCTLLDSVLGSPEASFAESDLETMTPRGREITAMWCPSAFDKCRYMHRQIVRSGGIRRI